MAGITENNLHRSFEHSVHRHPVDPCALHRDVSAFALEQPIAQTLQLIAKGSESTLDDLRRAAPPIDATRRNRFLVYVQTCPNHDDHFHDSLLSSPV